MLHAFGGNATHIRVLALSIWNTVQSLLAGLTQCSVDFALVGHHVVEALENLAAFAWKLTRPGDIQNSGILLKCYQLVSTLYKSETEETDNFFVDYSQVMRAPLIYPSSIQVVQ